MSENPLKQYSKLVCTHLNRYIFHLNSNLIIQSISFFFFFLFKFEKNLSSAGGSSADTHVKISMVNIVQIANNTRNNNMILQWKYENNHMICLQLISQFIIRAIFNSFNLSSDGIYCDFITYKCCSSEDQIAHRLILYCC